MLIKLFLSIVLLSCLPVLAFAAKQDSYPSTGLLPSVKAQMLTAGYWIAQHPSPDDVMMNEAQIQTFNERIRNELKLTKNIFSLIEDFQMESLLEVLKKNLSDFTDRGFYTAQGVRNDNAWLDKVKANMRLSGLVLGVAPRYGVIVHLADQRFLPTKQGLYAQRGDFEFDELQNSALDVGTPVAVIHQSLDGKWLYVLSALSDGWVEVENVAICDLKSAKGFVETNQSMLVVSPRADIYLDSGMRSFYDALRMGASLPLIEEQEDFWVLQMPLRNKEGKLQIEKGYVLKSQMHLGYLPYTARTIYQQAFQMFHQPYGWGDMNGGQDCSRFLQMVFATVGLQFPRDSKNQAQIGQQRIVFDDKLPEQARLAAFENLVGAKTILCMKGHIMLFLGMDQGVPFAIHATSGYSKTIDEKQVKFVLNKVVVSDLSLGEGSAKGSLLRRISKIVGIESNEN